MSGFDGFPKEMIKFFTALDKNNSKSWFEAKNPQELYSKDVIEYVFSHFKSIAANDSWHLSCLHL